MAFRISVSAKLSGAWIRDRLSACRPPSDPTQVNRAYLRPPWSKVLESRDSNSLTPAGVLIALSERAGSCDVLLTKRSENLKMHAGQVSFPGGRMDPGDSDVIATALRETHEEVGIAPSKVQVAGCLRTMPTITGYAVTPIVGFVEDIADLVLEPAEVDAAFQVPLAFLLDEVNEVVVEREVLGLKLPMIEYRWASLRIWGATAYMILELKKQLLK